MRLNKTWDYTSPYLLLNSAGIFLDSLLVDKYFRYPPPSLHLMPFTHLIWLQSDIQADIDTDTQTERLFSTIYTLLVLNQHRIDTPHCNHQDILRLRGSS